MSPIIPSRDPLDSDTSNNTFRAGKLLVEALDKIALAKGYTRNEIVNFFLKAGIAQYAADAAAAGEQGDHQPPLVRRPGRPNPAKKGGGMSDPQTSLHKHLSSPPDRINERRSKEEDDGGRRGLPEEPEGGRKGAIPGRKAGKISGD